MERTQKFDTGSVEAIKDPARVARYAALVGEMMSKDDGEEFEFDLDWIRTRGWAVVPQESKARNRPIEVERWVKALAKFGVHYGIAIFNEPGYLHNMPIFIRSEPPTNIATCYDFRVDKQGLSEIYRRLGLFRFVISEEHRTFAVSCNEWYNLIVGTSEVVEALLGESAEDGWSRFNEFAKFLLTETAPEPLRHVTERYRSA